MSTYDPKRTYHSRGLRCIVVSTQGRGDEAALFAAFAVEAEYVAFVGSRKKAAH
jgi:xanthine dehydrogenase accessory factor